MHDFSKQTITSAGTDFLLQSPKTELHIIFGKVSKYPYNLQLLRCLEILIVSLWKDPDISPVPITKSDRYETKTRPLRKVQRTEQSFLQNKLDVFYLTF